MKTLLALLVVLLASTAHAAGEDAAERKQPSQRRVDIEERFTRESEACRQRFVVNACLDRLRAQRLADLKPVHARIEVLDAEARRERSKAQRERVAERQREAAIEEGKRVNKTLSTPPPAVVASPASAPRTPRVSAEAHAKSVREQQAVAAQDARRNREQSALRQAEFDKRQRDQQQKEQDRAAQTRKPGISLPVPTAAEIAAAASGAASGAKR